MILLKKLFRTYKNYRGQFLSMILMVVLGIGIFSGFNAEWYTIEKNISFFFAETNYADYNIYNTNGSFTEDDVKKIEEIQGITSVSRFSELLTSEGRKNETIKLAVTENFDVSGFVLLEGKEYDKDSADALWLSHNYAGRNNYAVGDSISLTYGKITKEYKIAGIIMSGTYLINTADNALMPDYDTIGYAYISPKAYEELSTEFIGMAYYPQINVKTDLSENEFSAFIDKALGKTLQIVPKEDTTSYSEAYGESDEGKTMGSMLPVIFLLIAILTMVTTMSRITSKEKGQIGILKALGFKNRTIVMHYTSYALFVGVIGSVVGLGLGFAVNSLLMSENGSMGTYFEMPSWKPYMPWFVYFGIIGIIIFLGLIGFLSVRKQLSGSAADALRPYTPKNSGNLLIEKTKIFHKLNFATRWNMRDSFRHKARSFVSVFGVFGCTLLLFACFGMLSTMNNYIDTNYNVIMNYESKLSVSDNTDNSRAKEIAEQYKGDYSGNAAVKMNGETYIMTVFNDACDKYRLLDTDNSKLEAVSENGVYICTRMADTQGLKVGDSFEFSIYGDSTKQYTVSVAGIVCSNAEGFQIPCSYAESLQIPYQIDTVYTDVKKSDIKTNDEIVSIMTKSEIIKSFDSFMSIMNEMIALLVVFLLSSRLRGSVQFGFHELYGTVSRACNAEGARL